MPDTAIIMAGKMVKTRLGADDDDLYGDNKRDAKVGSVNSDVVNKHQD